MTKRTKSAVCAGGALLAVVLAAPVVIWRSSDVPSVDSVELPATGLLTVAATGDSVITRPIALDSDAALAAVVELLRGATLAITNLEMTLLSTSTAERVRRRHMPRWVFGTAREAAALRSLGFDVVIQANNHATDYGPEGMLETRAALTAAGLAPVGGGRDLREARAPVLIGSGLRTIAVLAVAVSASSRSMATPSTATATGWPGINALGYVAEVTADPVTYERLRGVAPARYGDTGTASNGFTLGGARIRQGTETSVNLAPDAQDVAEILAEVARARAVAEVVVLSIHSHEPSNESEEPAEFVRVFARQAIDAGAHLVVGHGPHRLRGVETYRGGAILYSLGNFLYQPEDGVAPLADAYEVGGDMFGLALGMGGSLAVSGRGVEGDAWWNSVVAMASFEAGALRSLHLHPLDLGRALPETRRGIPRTPSSARALTTLDTLVRLSQRYGTLIRVERGVGIVDIDTASSP